MTDDAIDAQLLAIVTRPAPVTIPDVIATMQAIDNLLPVEDGLKWFNLLYLKVTQRIDGQPPATAWQDPQWLTRLDVIFAGHYFAAIAEFLQDSPNTPRAWDALLEARHSPGIDRIQFALAGLNAHINHDLALALNQTDSEMNLDPGPASPEHADFQAVNGILEATLPDALTFLATGILGVIAQDTGKIGRFLAIFDVRVARDAAWDFAAHLRALPEALRDAAMVAQDRVTGALGRSLLLPV
jgi:hypothetical protein